MTVVTNVHDEGTLREIGCDSAEACFAVVGDDGKLQLATAPAWAEGAASGSASGRSTCVRFGKETVQLSCHPFVFTRSALSLSLSRMLLPCSGLESIETRLL